MYREFPIPLINRLEKHFVSSNTVLRDFELDVCKALEKWIDLFVNEAETGLAHCKSLAAYFFSTNYYCKENLIDIL